MVSTRIRHAAVGAGLSLVLALSLYALVASHWLVFAIFPTAGAVWGSAMGLRSNAQTSLQKTLLTLGYLIGPFILATLVCIGFAIAGWAKLDAFWSWLVVGLPVAGGCLCLWLRQRPMGWNVLLLIPYAALYGVATTMFAILPAMMLGAPK